MGDTDPADTIRKQKASLHSLEHHMHKTLVIECGGHSSGRMVRGVLKGFDSNMNLILLAAVVVHQDAPNPFKAQLDDKDICRELGATVLRGSAISAIYNAQGTRLQEQPQQDAE